MAINVTFVIKSFNSNCLKLNDFFLLSNVMKLKCIIIIMNERKIQFSKLVCGSNVTLNIFFAHFQTIL